MIELFCSVLVLHFTVFFFSSRLEYKFSIPPPHQMDQIFDTYSIPRLFEKRPSFCEQHWSSERIRHFVFHPPSFFTSSNTLSRFRLLQLDSPIYSSRFLYILLFPSRPHVSRVDCLHWNRNHFRHEPCVTLLLNRVTLILIFRRWDKMEFGIEIIFYNQPYHLPGLKFTWLVKMTVILINEE